MKRIINGKILLVLLLACSFFYFELNANSKKELARVEVTNQGWYIVRYSNIIVTHDNRKVKVPIYGGVYESISLEELQNKEKIKESPLGSLYIQCKKGKAKETLFSLLKFYKARLFHDIDINLPTSMGRDGDLLIIWYDYIYEGIPCSMMIGVDEDEKGTKKNLENKGISKRAISNSEFLSSIELNEDKPFIAIQIVIGWSSPFKK